MSNAISQTIRSRKGRLFFPIVLFVICIFLTFAALLLPIASRPNSLPMEIGSVAPADIVAPRDVSYQSAYLTSKAIEDAENAVAPRYLASDPAINRAQLDKLHNIFHFITSVRSDAFSSDAQRINDLLSIAMLKLAEDQAVTVLNLTDEQWKMVQDDSRSVLEQIMRKNIRDYQLQENINNVPGLINYALNSDENELVRIFVSSLIVPNSLYSEAETENARKQAADQVEPVIKSYAENQVIVLRGQIITPEQWEALEFFNLIRAKRLTEDIISTVSIVLALSGFLLLYFSRRKNSALSDIRSLTVVAICFFVFLFAAKVIIPNRAILPFFFPLPAFALILVTLFNLELSIVLPIILSILVTFSVSNSIELSLFYIITSLTGAVVLGKGKKFVNFLYAAVAIILSGILVITAYRLTRPQTDLFGLLTLYGVIFLNGFASASLALLLQFFLAQILQLATPLYLIELSRSDHPLLRKILQSAPGTYQHSLQVSNLAEQAANAIGADALLTRVGAYYHDAGKSADPTFFIENQVPGNLNPHDDMDPVIAAQTIIAHVSDGITLAEKHHLPPRLQDFIREHHGTLLTRYQYNRAVEQQGNDPSQVDAELFRYPGPKPQSKETGILMLADISEARARSKPPKNESELTALLNSVVDNLLIDGSLEDTNLTLHDLKMIKESFHTTLMNTYHPRIQYPELKPMHPQN